MPAHWRDTFHSFEVLPMFHTPIEPRIRISPSIDRLMAFVGKPLPFPAAMDLCREQVPAAADGDATRFAADARRSSSRHAFRPAFTADDWRTFSSFCVARRLPPGHRVLVPGCADRTLGFVVEGSLCEEPSAAARGTTRQPTLLLPGTILGEDALFSDGPGERDVRTLEDSLVLELSFPRQKELTAACPAIAFELLRAAGAVIAARARKSERRDELAMN
jgi:CRP/FNR family transcriptional regulator, cyclic AMP receptor protein